MAAFLQDKSRWEKIRNNPEYKTITDMIKKGYDDFCADCEIPVIKFSDEMEFIKKGTRTQFEKKYFLRRKQLTIYALLSLLYPEKEEYFEKLEDVIGEICNEYSWQVPAHRSQKNPNRRDGIALFSAETGFYLAEIKQLFGYRLNPLLKERITTELDKRILTSFENELTGIEIKEVTNNWASVLGCSIGLTFMYESPERFEGIFDRIQRHMELYMKGISDDGGTCEGANYWNYGFSFFMMYYDTLSKHTGGRCKEILEDEKVNKAAKFFTSVVMDEKNVVSFGDSSSKPECHIWFMHFLNQKYGMDMPPKGMGMLDFTEFASVLRAFWYYNPDAEKEGVSFGESYFDMLKWYIKRGKNYSFAAKGGKNDPEDNHNHNDIGSFIVLKNGKELLCDLGAPVYTSTNFGATRYGVLNNSSLGHNVPVINGKEQIIGIDCMGEMQIGDKIIIDLKKAYPDKIDKFSRSFELLENSVILCDEFCESIDVKERFVTDFKPEIDNGCVVIDEARLSIPSNWLVNISEADTTYRSGDARKVYLIDFSQKAHSSSFEMVVSFT